MISNKCKEMYVKVSKMVQENSGTTPNGDMNAYVINIVDNNKENLGIYFEKTDHSKKIFCNDKNVSWFD